MRKKWPNVDFNNSKGAYYDPGPYAVNSGGRIYSENFLRKEHQDEQNDDEYLVVRGVTVDIGPNDDILYALEFPTDDRENRIEYLRLKVYDLKCKFLRVITKGLPPSENIGRDLWAMRALENKIVLCNEFGEVFVLTCSDTQDQLNLDCLFFLPSSSRKTPWRPRQQPFMCVKNKREVIIASSDNEEVYICPITEEEQMEGVIRIPLEKHETKSSVRGVAFDATHEEDIIVLRSNRNLNSKYQIEVYSRNGDTLGLYPLPGCWSVDSNDYYLLSNPKGIVAVVRPDGRKITFWNLVGKVFVQP